MTVDLRRKNEVRLAASPSLFAIHILFFSADMNVITKKKGNPQAHTSAKHVFIIILQTQLQL